MPAGGCFVILFIAIVGGIIANSLWGVVGVVIFLVALLLLLSLTAFNGRLGHLRLHVEKEQQQAAIPPYHPPQQQTQGPEPPIQTPSPLGFDLTPTEYNQLAKQYQQGYRVQPPQQGGYQGTGQPKQDSSSDYEQSQTHHLEHLPPMIPY